MDLRLTGLGVGKLRCWDFGSWSDRRQGAKPADLPIERPTKFELIINLKTEGTPHRNPTDADEVIESKARVPLAAEAGAVPSTLSPSRDSSEKASLLRVPGLRPHCLPISASTSPPLEGPPFRREYLPRQPCYGPPRRGDGTLSRVCCFSPQKKPSQVTFVSSPDGFWFRGLGLNLGNEELGSLVGPGPSSGPVRARVRASGGFTARHARLSGAAAINR